MQQHRSASVIVRAEKFDTQEFVKNVSDKWDETENKGQVVTLVAGATAALWVSSSVVGAINYIPLLPKVMELVGLGYSAWFVYRYVLFKDSRKELQETKDFADLEDNYLLKLAKQQNSIFGKVLND